MQYINLPEFIRRQEAATIIQRKTGVPFAVALQQVNAERDLAMREDNEQRDLFKLASAKLQGKKAQIDKSGEETFEEVSEMSKSAEEARVEPKTGPFALLRALKELDINALVEEAKADLKSGKKTKRSRAVAILNIAKGLENNNIKPEDLMLDYVGVVPTKFRPFLASGGTLIPGDANVLYKDLFDIRDAHNAEKDVLGEEASGDSRLDLYDAVRSVYGYGDAVKQKTRQKDVQGFLKKVVGNTSKFSYWQRRVLSKTQDNVGRSTIIVDPELSLDQIGIPKEIAFTSYAPYIQARLIKKGFKPGDALIALKDRTDEALAALEEEIKERPVIYSRAPSWHRFSVLAGNPKLIDGSAIAINPLVTTGLGADFDGDAINIHVPASAEAVNEAKERLFPSKYPFSSREADRIVPAPKQEQIWSLYTADTRPSENVHTFATQQEAISAIRKGNVKLSDTIEITEKIPGLDKAASSIEKNIPIEATISPDSGISEFNDGAMVDTTNMPVFNFLAKESPDSVDLLKRKAELRKKPIDDLSSENTDESGGLDLDDILALVNNKEAKEKKRKTLKFVQNPNSGQFMPGQYEETPSYKPDKDNSFTDNALATGLPEY